MKIGQRGLACIPVPPKSADVHAKICTIHFVSFLWFIRNQNIRTPMRIDLKSIGIQQILRKHLEKKRVLADCPQ